MEALAIKRKTYEFDDQALAEILGLRTTTPSDYIKELEEGKKRLSGAKLEILNKFPAQPPFKDTRKDHKFSFIDLFAGVGGIRIPYQELGGKCVLTSEWDKYAKIAYATNFGEYPQGDITQITAETIPDHDILLGGFPCQAFSQAGLKKGFNDTRGTMFFEIQRILAAKRPKAFMLENVKQLKGHDKGRTLQTILKILQGDCSHSIPDDVPMSEDARQALSEKLNYWVDYKVLRATDFGVPQNRERIFIVGLNKDYFKDISLFDSPFKWPEPTHSSTCLGDILEPNHEVPEMYTISERIWESHQRRKDQHRERGNGFGYSLFNHSSPYANTISARYYKDGSEILIDQSDIGKRPRKLTPRECARLQGFPRDFIYNAVSDNQAYKQFGNSVAVPVIRAVASSLVKALETLD